MDRTSIRRRMALGFSAATLFAGTIAGPAFAADAVTQTVTAGTRSAVVANLVLGSVAYSHSAQSTSGSMGLTVDDSTGSGAGWNVTIVSSAFVHSGGVNIPAVNFALTSAVAPVMTAGQAINVTAGNGPAIPTVSPVGTLDTARKTVQAGVGYGQGTYTQALPVTLSIPALSRAGTYTGTLTTTITAAP